MGEFNDRPFTAGTITGLRGFLVTDDGDLTGIVHQTPWTPGENVAVHHINYDDPFGFSDITVPRHEVAGINCRCGFYAYCNGGNDYHRQTMGAITVQGIVEGYGLVTVGTRGFRASKARLAAIVLPPFEEPKQRPLRWWDILNLGIATWDTGYASYSLLTGAWDTALVLLGLTVFPLGTVALNVHTRRRRRDHTLVPGTLIPKTAMQAVRATYSDVPIYDTLDEALTAHPLTELPFERTYQPQWHTAPAVMVSPNMAAQLNALGYFAPPPPAGGNGGPVNPA